MKKNKLLLILLVLCSTTVKAQEYATREVIPFEADAILPGSPIDVTKESSMVEFSYFALLAYTTINQGDFIGGISYYGYNPGKELKRHVKIWMTEQDNKVVNQEDKWFCVYDGDITIPSGGSSDEHIPLLSVDFEKNYEVKKLPPYFFLKIECSGETSEEPLYFEYNTIKKSPVARYAVLSEVKCLTGTVKDQNGLPIRDAHVQLYNDAFSAEDVTDSEGVYQIRVEQSNSAYMASVSAQGYATYKMECSASAIRLGDAGTSTVKDFVLYDKVYFKKDQRATIILPVAPNPGWGRFYRLDSREGSDFYFEREETPQANVPYVIFPNMDFELNIGDYDLQQEPGKIVAPHPENTNENLEQGLKYIQWATLYGSYQSMDVSRRYEDEPLYFLDATPDCENNSFLGRVGACRAYLRMYTTGRDTPQMIAPNLIFADEPTDIYEAKSTPVSTSLYDLQGRLLQGKPRKGVYIQNGNIYIVK